MYPLYLQVLSEEGSVSFCRNKSGQHKFNQALKHSDTLWVSILQRYPLCIGQCHSRARSVSVNTYFCSVERATLPLHAERNLHMLGVHQELAAWLPAQMTTSQHLK